MFGSLACLREIVISQPKVTCVINGDFVGIDVVLIVNIDGDVSNRM